MITIGILFWIAENIWFGWNRYPSCYAEVWCDKIAGWLIVIGIFRLWVVLEIKKHITRFKKDE